MFSRIRRQSANDLKVAHRKFNEDDELNYIQINASLSIDFFTYFIFSISLYNECKVQIYYVALLKSLF
jgi:hypothetical protein